MATNLEEPSYYLRDIQVREDRIFGTALFVDWNAYQFFGMKNAPQGTRWDFSTDYLEHARAGSGHVVHVQARLDLRISVQGLRPVRCLGYPRRWPR